MNRYQQIQDTAQRWMDVIWSQRDLAQFDHIHHPDFIDYSPAGRGSSRSAYQESITALFNIFPDFYALVEDIIIDETQGKAAIRWSATGTQAGEFLGLAATQKVISFQGIEIISVDRQGMITARWGEWDGLNLLQQITTE
jgi:steroid delta-isomerase-like uncharacterized protein